MTTHRSPIFALSDSYVEKSARLSPMSSTYLGLTELNDQLDDFSIAVRAVLDPVLARPTVCRALLPLRALLGRLVSPILVSIGTVDIRNCNPHAWPPHRRHPSLAPREV